MTVQRWRGRYIGGDAVAEAARLEGYRVSAPNKAGDAWIGIYVRKTPRAATGDA